MSETSTQPAPSALAIAADKRQDISTRVDSVRKVMIANKDKIARGVSEAFSVDRAIMLACNSIRKNPKLLDCTPQSLFGALAEASTYGWVCDGITGQAYLIPFGKDVVLVPGYKGLRDLVRRSGQCTVTMESVHQGDQYQYRGRFELPQHKYSDDPQRRFKPLTHAYVIGRFKNSTILTFSWTVGECLAHRDRYSQGWKRQKSKDSPWHPENAAFRIMCMKTVLLDAIHRGEFPMSVDDQQIASRELDIVQMDAATVEAEGHEIVEDLALPAPEEHEEEDEAAIAAAAEIHQQTPTPTPDDESWEPGPNLKGLEGAFDDCEGIRQADAIRKQAIGRGLSEREAFIVDTWHRAAVERIRASRGERSNG